MSMVEILQGEAAYDCTWDARIVAFRWDLIPWALVWDLDTPVSEAPGARIRRAWVVFGGVGDLELPMSCRLPNGVWTTSALESSAGTASMRRYSVSALLPEFDGDTPVQAAPTFLRVQAQNILVARSVASAEPAEFGLSHAERQSLATDGHFLGALQAETGQIT